MNFALSANDVSYSAASMYVVGVFSTKYVLILSV